MSKRVKTGIKGFDKLVEGGLPEGFTILISGTPGTGKTLFALEYLHNGATESKEKSMFVTLEQNLDDVRSQAKRIGLDLKRAENNSSLTLMHVPVEELSEKTIEKIKEEVSKRKIKRLVIDSLSTLAINAPIYTPIKDLALRDVMDYKAFFSPPILGDFVVKRFIYGFLADLKELGCTTIVISEAPEKGEYISRDTISEFVCDGVILLNFESLGGDYSRSLVIRKMRGTKHNEDVHPVEISDKGITIHDIK